MSFVKENSKLTREMFILDVFLLKLWIDGGFIKLRVFDSVIMNTWSIVKSWIVSQIVLDFKDFQRKDKRICQLDFLCRYNAEVSSRGASFVV